MDWAYFSSIANSLKSAKKPHCFAAGGVHAVSMPSLSLNILPDIILSFPLGVCQQKLLTSSSVLLQQEGENKKNAWELSPSKFTINNTQWNEEMQKLLTKVRHELAVDPKLTVTSELKKLLLYEPGGFREVYRDAEKAEGLFGTLLIQLPSEYTGGSLVVYHLSMCKDFNFGGTAGCANIHYAAFYTSCDHEIKPTSGGSAVYLVYDLICKDSDVIPVPPDNHPMLSTIIASLRTWEEESNESPPMMTYLLENKYRDVPLTFDALKSSDRAVADILAQAKNEANFDFYVAKLRLKQSWSATGNYSGYRRNGDDALEDLIEESIVAEKIKSIDGDAISGIPLEKEYIVPNDFFDTLDPDVDDFEEGHEDEEAVVCKQFYWSAILIWPSVNRFVVLGVNNMIKSLSIDLRAKAISAEKKAELEGVAMNLLRVCNSAYRGKDVSAESYAVLLRCLRIIGKEELISTFFSNVVLLFHSTLFVNSSFCQEVVALSDKFGMDVLKSLLRKTFNQMTSSIVNLDAFCSFLLHLSQVPSSEAQDLCQSYAGIIVRGLPEEQGQASVSSWYLSSSDSYLALLKVLMYTDDMENILSVLNCTASAACVVNLVKNPLFCELILVMGKKYGWNRVTENIQEFFKKAIKKGNPIEICHVFISNFAQEPCQEAQREVCRDLIGIILSGKPSTGDLSPNAESYVSLLKIAQTFDIDLVTRTLEAIAGEFSIHGSLLESPAFIEAIFVVGAMHKWDVLRVPLLTIFNGTASDVYSFDTSLQFLSRISQNPISEVQISVCRDLAEIVIRVLEKEPNTEASSLSVYRFSPSPISNNPRGKKFILFVLNLIDNVQCDEKMYTVLVELLIAKPIRYPPLETLVPVCEGLYKSLNGEQESEWLKRLGDHCISTLESEQTTAVERTESISIVTMRRRTSSIHSSHDLRRVKSMLSRLRLLTNRPFEDQWANN